MELEGVREGGSRRREGEGEGGRQGGGGREGGIDEGSVCDNCVWVIYTVETLIKDTPD